MDLTLQIGEGILFPNALNDAVNAVKPLATSNLVNVDGSSDGIELEMEITEGADIGDAIADVVAAFSTVSTSTIASVDTTNSEPDQIFPVQHDGVQGVQGVDDQTYEGVVA